MQTVGASTWTLIVNGYLVRAGVFVAVSILSLSHGKTAVLWPFLVVWLVWVVGINARAGPIALGIWLGV
jgi:hypothetical protein